MDARRFALPLAAASLVATSHARGGMGAGVHFDAIVDRVSLVFDAEVTDAVEAGKYGNAIDFTIHDIHVLRGTFPTGATHVTFEHGNWGEPGKPDYVDPGSAFEAGKAKSGRWIFFGMVTKGRATAVHVRPISDLAMVETRLGLPASSPSASASAPPPADAAPTTSSTTAPPPTIRPTRAGCGCVVAGEGESGASCVIAFSLLTVAALSRRSS